MISNNLSSISEAEGNDALKMVFNALEGLKEYFDDPSVQEIMINGPDDAFIERNGEYIKLDIELSTEQINSAIVVLGNRAGISMAPHTKDCILNARWPGVRVAATMEPISLYGPTMCIRKHSNIKLTLDEMCDQGVMNKHVLEILKTIIAAKKNILIVGGTSSGKTTFLKAMIRQISHKDRVITIEDVPELDIEIPNRVAWKMDKELDVFFSDLLMLGLRYSPERFILGEVRDGAALILLNAANTGHDGSMATLHANSSYEGLTRFEDCVMEAGSRIPLLNIQRRISTTFHYVIFMGVMNGKRKLLELLKLEDFDMVNGQYETTEIFKEKRNDY